MKKKLLMFFLINLFNLNIIKSIDSSETTIQKEQREKEQRERASTRKTSEETTIQKEQREKEQREKEQREKEQREKEQREKEQREKVATTTKPSEETAAQRELHEKELREKELREKELREKELREKELRERNITNINQKEKSNPKLDLKQEAEKSMSEIPNLLKKIEVYIEDLPAEEKLILKELILNINKIKDELKDNLIKLAASLNSDQATILSLTS